MTWMAKLCVLCAMSALAEFALPSQSGRESLRMICGLLMLHLTAQSAKEIAAAASGGGGLAHLLEIMMG